MAGVEDVGAGTGRPRAAGRHETCHRHPGRENRPDDLAHRGVEPARGVDAQQHQLRPVLFGAQDAAHDVVGAGRADRALQPQQQHRRGRGAGPRRCQQAGEPQHQREPGLLHEGNHRRAHNTVVARPAGSSSPQPRDTGSLLHREFRRTTGGHVPKIMCRRSCACRRAGEPTGGVAPGWPACDRLQRDGDTARAGVDRDALAVATGTCQRHSGQVRARWRQPAHPAGERLACTKASNSATAQGLPMK